MCQRIPGTVDYKQSDAGCELDDGDDDEEVEVVVANKTRTTEAGCSIEP